VRGRNVCVLATRIRTERLGQELPAACLLSLRKVATELADSLAAAQSGRDDFIGIRYEAGGILILVYGGSIAKSRCARVANIILAYTDRDPNAYYSYLK
jgi:hypothetical protein